MRIDKYLKVSRIIKRRSIANQACSAGAIKINGKNAKPGSKVNVGDHIQVELGTNIREFEVLLLADTIPKDKTSDMYKQIS
ncbi:MAG: RNA-binding S4 domain-containing protein [Clostridiales bacterium]|nr:RNA-binding S4 domain-containing protein [Clostridiales bacterium]